MRFRYAVLSLPLALSAFTTGHTQQSMGDMPGMNMGQSSTQKQTKPADTPATQPSTTKTAPKSTTKTTGQHSMSDMPGMDMSGHQHQATPKKPSAPHAQDSMGDMPGMKMDHGQMQDGDQHSMHDMPGMNMSQPATSEQTGNFVPQRSGDFQSVTVPIQDLQEPEAIDLRTGKDLPAPELLNDVVTRTPMTLANFIELADKSNPTLRQAENNVERSKSQAKQMGLLPNPTVGYSGDEIRGGSFGGGEQGAFFSQEIVLGRKLALRKDIYRAEGHANELAVEVQKARVHSDVTRGFFDTLSAQATVVVQDRLLKVALDNETNAHELMRIGQADAADVLKAEVAAEQAKVDFVDAQRMFLGAFHQLATSAGQSNLAPAPLAGALAEPPQVDSQELVNRAVNQSPAVLQAQANVSTEEARLKSARRESVPNLNLRAGESYSLEALDSPVNKKVGWMSYAEAGVQIPLWNRNQGNIDASKALIERAKHDVLRTQLWTKNRTEPLAQEYERARFMADRYRTEMLPRARRAYQLEVMKYQQMAQPYPHILSAQQMLFTLQLGYIRALHDQWNAVTLLQNAALEGALDQPTSSGSDETTRNLPTGGGN